ncbi:hypothetical protein [Escherichia coli]
MGAAIELGELVFLLALL